MRHAEQGQQVDEQRHPYDAAADAEQPRHEPGREAGHREYEDARRKFFHSQRPDVTSLSARVSIESRSRHGYRAPVDARKQAWRGPKWANAIRRS
jgi:hypothetical protein